MTRAQELCESRGGHPGIPVLNGPYGLTIMVSVDAFNPVWYKATLAEEEGRVNQSSGTV